MQVIQALLATCLTLTLSSNGLVSATEAGMKMEKTPAVFSSESESASRADAASNSASLPAEEEENDDDGNDMFVYKVPFISGNITGTMVITIDKSSFSRVSDSTPTDPSKVYDFGQLHVEKKTKSGSGGEERGLFDFVATHFVQYKLTQKAVSWVKSIF